MVVAHRFDCLRKRKLKNGLAFYREVTLKKVFGANRDLKNDDPPFFFSSGGDWDRAGGGSVLGSTQVDVSRLNGDGSSRKELEP